MLSGYYPPFRFIRKQQRQLLSYVYPPISISIFGDSQTHQLTFRYVNHSKKPNISSEHHIVSGKHIINGDIRFYQKYMKPVCAKYKVHIVTLFCISALKRIPENQRDFHEYKINLEFTQYKIFHLSPSLERDRVDSLDLNLVNYLILP